MNTFGKKGSDVVSLILRSGNGRSIQIVVAVCLWWINEVSAGIHEGLEGCVQIADQGKGLVSGQRCSNDAATL